jgi:hypothetical protein
VRRLLLLVSVLAVAGLGAFVPSAATPAPVRSLSVAGTGVAMYPAFDAAIDRYGLTTTADTGGTVDVTATTTDPAGVVLVDGRTATSPTTHLSGLASGDEISVVIDDAGGRTAYSVVYLPAGFPAFDTSGTGAVAPGYLGAGVTTFAGGPAFEALLDRNGVPAWVHEGNGNDLKRQPNGELTVMRNTTGSGTGMDLVTLDDQFQELSRRRMAAPFTDTDNHDSERLLDGSTILIGYEPRGACTTGYLDATIEEQDPDGNVVFTWSSEGLESESLNATLWPPTGTCSRIDYAHINSVQEIPDGSHDLLVSFRQLSAVYRIATVPHDGYAAGDVVWRLGGRHSSFTFAPGEGGPCAQHDATWVGTNRVLLFDNGSVKLGASQAGCVDPADPTGPGIARTYTRVTEYELDPVLGTATIPWSYAPAGTFTFFAGSASRLGNGDTLVGWASDRQRFATEVDAAGTELWSLNIPGNTQSVGYTSYRVSLVDYTDKLAPTVDAGPVDASYVTGDQVTAPAYSCTDRGGSNLQSCTVTGVTGGLLDTSTPGPQTWQVTAEDGAGNTTTVARHYTVRLPGRVPDGLVRKAGGSWRGNDVYGSPTGQTVRERVRRTRTAVAHWRIQNDGERADAFRLVAPGSNRRFRVHYLSDGVDVTAAVVAGTYRTPTLQPGQSVTLRVTVKPTRRSRVGSTRTVTMTSVSTSDSSRVDRVAASVTTRR